jgi:cellulose synthase/poly-beta-1,6-N-acetylglucosamine synthase-like glycosyltransferase
VIIASDGSDDGTNAVVQGYETQGVKLLALPRLGKAPALNAAADAASGEILAFSDANSMFAPDAIRALVRPFADPQVGGVAGNQRYLRKESGSGESSYWGFDRKLKQSQSRAGNAISATGAIYAIRRALFEPIPGGVTDDFFTSTGVMVRGYRLVFAPDAVAYEPVAASSGREFERKVRVITRGLQAVLLRRTLLNPLRHGFYALQLFSHKVLRRLVVFPLLIIAILSPMLWTRGLIYRLATLGQAVFYGLALTHVLLGERRVAQSKILALPFYFCMVNGACLLAAWNLLRGRRIERWEPRRQEGELPGVARPASATGRSER